MRTFELDVKIERSGVWHNVGVIVATDYRTASHSKLISHYIDEWLLANRSNECGEVEYRLRAPTSIAKGLV